MIDQFKENNFRNKSRKMIDQANEIIAEHEALGLTLTLRQLYYQFVSRNWLANTQRNYKNLGHTISEARLCGLIDWEAIEDRGRVPTFWKTDESMKSKLDELKASAGYFKLDPWADQDLYVELCVEKQALAGVLEPLAGKYSVPLCVNKGYTSQTAMYDQAERFKYAGKPGVLLYLGDFDPSGEDMVRDVRDRFEVFRVEDVEVKKIALTWEQIKKFKPPPNPVKFKDSRASAYIAAHGRNSWELDALKPTMLQKLIGDEIGALINWDRWEESTAETEKGRKKLTAALNKVKVPK